MELRRCTRLATNGLTRVRRRSGDPPVDWHRGPWPVNVTDVLTATAATYPDLVEAWARSIRATLDMVAASGGEADEGVAVILRDRASTAGIAPFTPHDMRRTSLSERT